MSLRSRLGAWVRRVATSIDGDACISFSRVNDRPTNVYIRVERIEYIDRSLNVIDAGLTGFTVLYSPAVSLREAKRDPAPAMPAPAEATVKTNANIGDKQR